MIRELAVNKRLLSSFVVLSILVAGFAFVSVQPANAVSTAPTVVKYSLPSGSNPLSLVQAGGYQYYASNTYGSIFKVNPGTGEYTTISFEGSHHWTAAGGPWKNAIWLVDSPSGLYAYNLTTSSLNQINSISTSNPINAADGAVVTSTACVQPNISGPGCTRYQTFLYSASGSTFDQIEDLNDIPGNPPNAGYHNFPNTISGGGLYKGFRDDGNGKLLFTDLNDGHLWIWDGSLSTITSTGHFTMSSYGGFTNPVGVAILSGFAYVANNVADGGISVFDLTTNKIVTTILTPGATPFDVITVKGGIVWDSSGSDGSICAVGGTCAFTGEANYYMNAIDSTVYAGYLGSSGVLAVSGLQIPTVSVTTVTSSSSTSSSSSSVISSSSTSSSSSVSSSTTSTSSVSSSSTSSTATTVSSTVTITVTATSTWQIPPSYFSLRDAATGLPISDGRVSIRSLNGQFGYEGPVDPSCGCVRLAVLATWFWFNATAPGYAPYSQDFGVISSGYTAQLTPVAGDPDLGVGVTINVMKEGVYAKHPIVSVIAFPTDGICYGFYTVGNSMTSFSKPDSCLKEFQTVMTHPPSGISADMRILSSASPLTIFYLPVGQAYVSIYYQGVVSHYLISVSASGGDRTFSVA